MLLSTIVGTPSASDLFERRQELVAARRASGLGATPADVARAVGGAALGLAVRRVDWDSQITPAWSYDPNAPAKPGGDWLMRAIKPVFRIVPAMGSPIEYAPYGKPDPTTKAVVAVAVTGAAVVGAVAFAGLLSRALKPRQANPGRRRRRRR